jgi:hypothetical protein
MIGRWGPTILMAAALAGATAGDMRRAVRAQEAASDVAAIPGAGEAARRSRDEASDWPCVQRKIPRLSPGTVWTGPSIEGLEGEWSKDDNLQELARTLVSRRTPIEEAGRLVAAFAASQGDEANRRRRLTLLFAATFAETDRLRAEILHGIERYTRNQRKLARKIDGARDEVQAQKTAKDGSEADRKMKQDKEDELAWEARVYKERENSLRYVCENPVILEQRLYQLAQEIQKVMSSQ